MAYIAAWKAHAFDAPLIWPEADVVALRFIQDHTLDLNSSEGSPAYRVAKALIADGLRRTLNCPSPATLDRRIASWRVFHRLRNLSSPFDIPSLRQAKAQARRAIDHTPNPKSPHPLTRDIMAALLDTCDETLRGRRDKAILMLGFASGGRKRSEITALKYDDIDLSEFAEKDLIWIRVAEAKPAVHGHCSKLPLRGQSARALVTWMEAANITSGPLFRPISKSDRALRRPLRPDAIRVILRHRLKCAGFPENYATSHGIRSGFLTQAALDGAPLRTAMKLSLLRSVTQVNHYYADIETEYDPASDLL